MKLRNMITVALVCGSFLGLTAKDIKTLVVTTNPQMHCDKCESKIKNNLRFEKGVKRIDTNIEAQTVTIQYDAEKTTPAALIKGFSKFGYKASEVKADEKNVKADAKNVKADVKKVAADVKKEKAVEKKK